MARTRGGQRLNSKTQDPAVAQDSTQHVQTVQPSKDKSKLPYVCFTCSKEYVLRDSFLAHIVTHTKEKLKNLKPKRQHRIKPPPASSPSSTSSSAVWEEVEDRSLTVPSTREKVPDRKLTAPAAKETELKISLENPSSNFCSPPSTPVTSTTLDTHEREFGMTSPSSLSSSPSGPKSSFSSLSSTPEASDTSTIVETREDKRQFSRTSSSSLSSDILSLFRKRPANTSSAGLKSATGQPALASQVTIPAPRHLKVRKTQTYIQEKNKEEPTIVISDDEEELGTEKIPGAIGTSSHTTPLSHLDGTSIEINEKEQDYSTSAMYTTPLKATNISYEDSVTAGNSYMNDVSQSNTNVIVSDDDEPSPPWRPESVKKNSVTKRLFLSFPIGQNKITNGGFNLKSREELLQNNESNNMLRRLGPGITVTKTNSDTFYKEETKEAIDKIRKLGPAISFSRAK